MEKGAIRALLCPTAYRLPPTTSSLGRWLRLVAARHTAACLLATLRGDLGQIVGGVADRLALAEPALFEHRLRVGVAIGFVRGTLTTLAGADLLAFPLRLREGRIAVVDATHALGDLLLFLLDQEPIDHRVDAGDAPR